MDDSQLVSTTWLDDNRHNPDLRIVDASFYLPHDQKDPLALFEQARIGGAVFFDIATIADHTTDLPHMVPSASNFVAQTAALGLGADHQLVIYDQRGIFSAPRCWWMFRFFGHSKVRVLDGGLPKWIAEGRPLERGKARRPAPAQTPLSAQTAPRLMATRDDILNLLAQETPSACILDARAAARFAGTTPESRPNLRAGHIPGSRNLPFDWLLSADGTLKSRPDLQQIFQNCGLESGQAVITTCGSGVTAAILALALTEMGQDQVAVYDGSWAEWGRPGLTPVEHLSKP